MTEWIREFPASITVCDREGTILEMNDRSAEVFAADGGRALIGRSLMGCHSANSCAKLASLFETARSNIYTIEKNGVKKMILQSPWYRDGEFAGLVEIAFEIPSEPPHFVRD